LLLLAGCGGDDGGGPGPAETSLKITYLPEGVGGPSTVWELRCDPAGGSLPGAAEACVKLAAAGAEAFSGKSPDSACTQEFGGPQAAQVEGSVEGEPVDSTFSRADGCEIARWDRLAFLFRPSGPK
jgi:hypothetical protein